MGNVKPAEEMVWKQWMHVAERSSLSFCFQLRVCRRSAPPWSVLPVPMWSSGITTEKETNVTRQSRSHLVLADQSL